MTSDAAAPAACDPAPAERRRDPRRATAIPARLTIVGYTVPGTLLNVSARGVCFVTTDAAVRVEAGNFVQIDFELPSAAGPRAVRRDVRVAHVAPAEFGGLPARRIGLEWDDPVTFDGTAD